jgi:TPR repeat protein
MTELDDIVIPEEFLDEEETASANPYLVDPAEGMGLIARLLAAPVTASAGAEARERLRTLIDEGFAGIAPFCGPSGATAMHELAAIRESIEELAVFPDLANKAVVGIGGSFSAGKSRFLNTLLGMTMLPEGVGPTTAIPTCLTDGEPAVRAQNLMNRMVAVNADELQALAHGFDRQYKTGNADAFGLAHLIKLLVVQEPSMRWTNLALLDTPGYDKPDGDAHALTDEQIARQQLSQADHVVWLVNARNGGLRGGDIRFLRSLELRQPVFFVLTQCDVQNTSALPGILRGVEAAAATAGIACAGVMGWSAPQGERQGRIVGGADIGQWLDGLDLQPRLTDKRRSAARLMESMREYLDGQIAAGREELALLNAFWPVAQQLSDDTVDGIRRLIAGRRESQRAHAAQAQRLEEFSRDLDAALTAALDAIALADARSEEAVESQYQDAMLLLRSRHGRKRDEEAFALLLDAACHDHMLAQYAIAECYRLGTGTAGDALLAFNWYRKAAGHGMAEAQYMLGQCYMEGEGIGADTAAALRWYQAAAEQEHPRAQMTLYAWYAGGQDGQDGQRDLPLALGWLRRAARQGLAEAEYELGTCYLEGRGVAKNRSRAGEWYDKAAQQGYALAQHAMGEAVLEDAAEPEDDAEAARWFRLAALQDLPQAQAALAACYLEGTGVPANRGHAASWYLKAERLGYVPAITGLGHCHFAAEEYEMGVRCYRRAADLGDAEAQYRLGECYLAGEGVRKNRNEAERWFARAVEQGYAHADDMPDEEFA